MVDPRIVADRLAFLARLMDAASGGAAAWAYVAIEGTAFLRQAGLRWQDVLRAPPAQPEAASSPAEGARDE
jgi:hypothetical protein